jgi:hypothetical protein
MHKFGVDGIRSYASLPKYSSPKEDDFWHVERKRRLINEAGVGNSVSSKMCSTRFSITAFYGSYF